MFPLAHLQKQSALALGEMIPKVFEMIACFFVEPLPNDGLVGLVLFRIFLVEFKKCTTCHLQKERKVARHAMNERLMSFQRITCAARRPHNQIMGLLGCEATQ